MLYHPKNKVGLKVKLIKNLTQYHRSLTRGATGITMGNQTIRSRYAPDTYVSVKFDDIMLDITWRDLISYD